MMSAHFRAGKELHLRVAEPLPSKYSDLFSLCLSFSIYHVLTGFVEHE